MNEWDWFIYLYFRWVDTDQVPFVTDEIRARLNGGPEMIKFPASIMQKGNKTYNNILRRPVTTLSALSQGQKMDIEGRKRQVGLSSVLGLAISVLDLRVATY